MQLPPGQFPKTRVLRLLEVRRIELIVYEVPPEKQHHIARHGVESNAADKTLYLLLQQYFVLQQHAEVWEWRSRGVGGAVGGGGVPDRRCR